jgi:hypothetical protein
MIIYYKYDVVFVSFFIIFPILFFYYKTCSWSIGFLEVLTISKLHHMFESNHSTFFVQSFLVSFLYKFLV